MRYLPYLIAVLILAGCSPQKRLNRLVENNPHLVQDTTYKDTTVVRRDTVDIDTSFKRADPPDLDSIFRAYADSFSSPRDSIIIREIETRVEERVRDSPIFEEDTVKKTVQGFRISLFENPDRTVGLRIHHTPPPDTVFSERTVERVKVEKTPIPDRYKVFAWIGGILIGIVVIYVVIRALKGGIF